MQFWVPGDLVKPEDDGTLLSKGFMLGIGLWNSTPSMPVTAESVGWLSLLAKAFHILRELLSISDDNSVLGLAAAHRLLLELHVQQQDSDRGAQESQVVRYLGHLL